MSDQDRDLYKWSDVPTPQGGQDGGQATQRFRDEVYDPHRSHGTPRDWQGAPPPPGYPPQQYRDGGYAMQQRQGDNVNNIIVYGDLYINQGGDNVRQCQRPDGRTEYYGRGCDYSRYCDPRQRQQVTYQEYGYREQPYVDNYYDRANYQHAWQRGQVYYEQPRGPVYEQRGPQYQRDSVQGGRDGYSADRERYNGGYTRYDGRQAGGYYNGGCFPTGGGGYYEGGSPQADGWDRAGQVFDFALRGFDAYAGYDIARRYAKNDGRRDHGGGYRGGGGYNDSRNRGNMSRAWQR